MPLSDSTIAIYHQAGFVPDTLMDQWAESGYTIGPIVEWSRIDVPTSTAVATLVGYTNGTHVSGISGISIDEWEEMLRDPALGIHSPFPGCQSASPSSHDGLPVRDGA